VLMVTFSTSNPRLLSIAPTVYHCCLTDQKANDPSPNETYTRVRNGNIVRIYTFEDSKHGGIVKYVFLAAHLARATENIPDDVAAALATFATEETTE